LKNADGLLCQGTWPKPFFAKGFESCEKEPFAKNLSQKTKVSRLGKCTFPIDFDEAKNAPAKSIENLHFFPFV